MIVKGLTWGLKVVEALMAVSLSVQIPLFPLQKSSVHFLCPKFDFLFSCFPLPPLSLPVVESASHVCNVPWTPGHIVRSGTRAAPQHNVSSTSSVSSVQKGTNKWSENVLSESLSASLGGCGLATITVLSSKWSHMQTSHTAVLHNGL